MNRFCVPFLLVGLSFITTTAKAEVIAYWNFNSLSIATASAPGTGGVPTTIAADQGSGTLSLADWTGLVDDFVGSTLNALNGDPGEESLSLISNAGNGSFIQVSFSMAGFTDLEVSFATRGTSSGFDAGQWSYSTDGTTFFDFGGNTATRVGSFAIASAGTTNGLDNVSTAFLRYTLDGATTASGNNRIDNLQLNATAIPEPSSLAVLGLISAGVAVRRRRKAVSVITE